MNQEWKNALKHLRLHFSLLLMPIFLFALSESSHNLWGQSFYPTTARIVFTFIILHLLVYPASNVFNSYYDRDTQSLGGIKNPPPINTKMLLLANLFDLLALALSFYLHINFFFLVLIYIIASRLYSYRKNQIKKIPFCRFPNHILFSRGIYFSTLYDRATTKLELLRPFSSRIILKSAALGQTCLLISNRSHLPTYSNLSAQKRSS